MQARPLNKTIGGVAFEDRFPQLQPDTDEALAWQWARDAVAQAAAEASPNYAPVRARLSQVSDAGSHLLPRKRGSTWFAVVDEAGDQVLRASDALGAPGRDLASRRALAESAGGGDVMLGFMGPSP